MMRQMGSMVLLLDEVDTPECLWRVKLPDGQYRSDQQACLRDGQCRSPLFSRFCTRTRK